jgi:hypothetical protein
MGQSRPNKFFYILFISSALAQKVTFCTATAMSAMGQKRQFALQNVMSALSPIADINRVKLDVG